MKKIGIVLMAIIVSAVASPAWAVSFGTNITVYDGVSDGGSGWYGSQEDNEVAPYMAIGQEWDLEGAFLDDSMLSIVGGFDFVDGLGDITIGDIFIDSMANAVYGPGAEGSGWQGEDPNVTNSFEYDIAIKLNMDTLTYDVVEIDNNSVVSTVLYEQNQESNPVSYVSGGNVISSGIGFTFLKDLTDADTGFEGDDISELTNGSHFAITGIDLSFLGVASFFGHITESCGNDNLMFSGKITHEDNPVVPEPATMLLFGLGLVGIAGIGRRKNLING